MIDRAMTMIANRLNAHLRQLYGVPEDLVAVSPLTDAEGKPAETARNRLVLFISNIASDGMARAPARGGISATGRVRSAQPVHLDIYFMLAASFEPETYGEGLKLLSSAVRYLQGHAVMTPQSNPEMPQGLAQLAVEISNLGSDELGQLWGNLGGRYVPSVHYKLRSIMIDSDAVVTVEPIIREPRSRAAAEAG